MYKILTLIVFISIAIINWSQVASYSLKYDITTQNLEGDDDSLLVQTLMVNLLSKSNFLVYHNSDSPTNYYDFKNQTIRNFKNDSSFAIRPLISVIASRSSEYENRIFLDRLMKSSGIETEVLGDMVNLECLFGIETNRKIIGTTIRPVNHGDTIVYIYEDIQNKTNRVVANVVLSEVEIPKKFQAAFHTFLIYETKLHPRIRYELLSKNRIPLYMDYDLQDFTKKRYSFKLSASGLSEVHVPLVDVSNRKMSEANQFLQEQFIQKSNQKPLKIQAKKYFKQSKNYMAEDQYLDALLCLFEYLLSSGNQPTKEVGEVVMQGNRNAELALFLDVLNEKKPTSLPSSKIKTLILLKDRNPRFAHILEIFIGNDLSELDSKSAIDYFLSALNKNANIAGAWGDLGKIYEKKLNFVNTWICFEIAISIAPEHPLLKSISAKKEMYLKEYPHYFGL